MQKDGDAMDQRYLGVDSSCSSPTNLLTGLVMSGDQLLLVSCLGESIYGLI